MGLTINTQYPMVGIRKTDAFITIKNRMPTFEAISKMPSIRIDIEHAKINIDQRECFAEIGLKDIGVFTGDIAQSSKEAGFKATAAISRKGDALARVDKNPKAIPAMAKEALISRKDYTVDSVPKSKPGTRISGGTIDINWDMGYMELKAVTKKPVVSATKGNIEIYLLQKGYIRITYEDEGFNAVI